jgi:hypothetical protein
MADPPERSPHALVLDELREEKVEQERRGGT